MRQHLACLRCHAVPTAALRDSQIGGKLRSRFFDPVDRRHTAGGKAQRSTSAAELSSVIRTMGCGPGTWEIQRDSGFWAMDLGLGSVCLSTHCGIVSGL
jgi:hypothetical protein